MSVYIRVIIGDNRSKDVGVWFFESYCEKIKSRRVYAIFFYQHTKKEHLRISKYLFDKH